MEIEKSSDQIEKLLEKLDLKNNETMTFSQILSLFISEKINVDGKCLNYIQYLQSQL